MNKELIETVESLGGTALMGGILIQFSDTAFEQALKKMYEAGVESEREVSERKFMRLQSLMDIREIQPNKPCCLAEREACANICKEMYLSGDMDTGLAEEAIQARGDGITLTTIRHPQGKPALGDLNPESLETMEIDVPEPVAWFLTLPDGRLSIKIVGKPTEGNWEPLYTTPPQRTWEPVETAPKDGTDVLLMYMHIDTQVVHNGFWIGASDADDESEIGWWSYDYSEVTRIKLDDWMNPTHWLPLPKLKEKNT